MLIRQIWRVLSNQRLYIAIATVAIILVTASTINVYSISSTNVASNSKWATMEDYRYIIFTDGINFYGKNGVTGVIDYSGTSAATVIQNVFDATKQGTIYVREGVYPLGTMGISISNDAVKVIGAGENSTVLTYTGSGAAISVERHGSTIARVGIERLGVDVDSTSSSAVAIQGIQYSQFTLRDIFIASNTGTGLKLDGGSAWSAYGFFENVRIAGSPIKGVDIVGSTPDSNNDNTFINVIAIYSPGTGGGNTIGFHIEQGNTNTIIGGDLEDWGTGMKIGSTITRMVGATFEGNAVDLNMTATSSNTLQTGVNYDSTPVVVDYGTNNHRADRFTTTIPNVDILRSLDQNTIFTLQSQRSVPGNAMIFQSEDQTFNKLLTRMAIQGGNTTANTKVQLTNAGLDMNGNNFKGIRSGPSATPSTSDILNGEWQIYKDMSTGNIKLCYNDAGTIKCSAAFS